MAEQLANNASTTLNGAIDSSVTSVVVADGSVFPATGNFRLRCDNELMLCTARSSNTLTVTRAQEGTTAASHTSTTIIQLVYTKGSFEQIIADYEQVGPWASRPATPRKGTVYSATDLLNAQWVYNGSTWDLIKPVVVQTSNQPNVSGWTALNHTLGATFTDKNGILEATANVVGAQLHGYYKTAPATPNSLTIGFCPPTWQESTFGWYVGYRDSVGGRLVVMRCSGNTGGVWSVEQWTSATAVSSSVSVGVVLMEVPRFMRAENDGTNLIFSLSFDGKNFTQVYTQAKATWLTNDQNQYGFFMYYVTSPPAAPVQNVYYHLLSVKE